MPLAVLAATAVAVASKQTDSPEVGVPWLYQGLMVWAFFWAFLDAFTIGANDVANAFANAVGAGLERSRADSFARRFSSRERKRLFIARSLLD